MYIVVKTILFVKLLSSKLFIAQCKLQSVRTVNTFPQVAVDDEYMITRSEHTITAITISSSLVVVVVFGGVYGDDLSDTVVLEFGEYYIIVMKHSVVHV